jgi:hypothetical protein
MTRGAGCISRLAHDLPEVIDTPAEAGGASQSAQVDHLTIVVEKGVTFAGRCISCARDLLAIVDTGPWLENPLEEPLKVPRSTIWPLL